MKIITLIIPNIPIIRIIPVVLITLIISTITLVILHRQLHHPCLQPSRFLGLHAAISLAGHDSWAMGHHRLRQDAGPLGSRSSNTRDSQ